MKVVERLAKRFSLSRTAHLNVIRGLAICFDLPNKAGPVPSIRTNRSTASMSIRMVNGYPCANCSDASLAKQGVDPTKASSLAESLALETKKKNGKAELPDAVTQATATDRARLDYSAELDILV